jgi:hypothetical protein
MADLSWTFAAINARRRRMVKAAGWLAASLVLATAAPATAQPTATDPAHLALARQVVAAVFSATTFQDRIVRLAETSARIVGVSVAMDRIKDAPDGQTPQVTELNAAALHHSLETSFAATLTARYEDESARAYARHFSDTELGGMLAFLTSAAGKASIARRLAFEARHDGSDGAPSPAYVETAADRAFEATAPGRAMKREQGAISQEMQAVIQGLWVPAIDAAQADYCARAPCGAAERAIFAGLGKIWDEPAPAGGH